MSTLACDPELGWLCFQCDLRRVQPHWSLGMTRAAASAGSAAASTSASQHQGPCRQVPQALVEPRDAFRRRVFVAPLALLIGAAASVFEH